MEQHNVSVDGRADRLDARSAGKTPTSHRAPGPSGAMRGRVAMFAVAAGATVAAYQGNSLLTPEADGNAVESDVYVLASGDTRAGGTAEPAAEPVADEVQWGDASTTSAVESLYDGQSNNAQREIREELDRRPKVVAPAVGSLTSGYGGRWGDFHGGMDIANEIGTEIKAATNGIVVDAGAAQGFGKWIRVMGDDGTLTVYGHVSSIDVQVGQRVTAGQRIGGMGSEGFSTGSHLHFEVWLDDGKHRVDPVPWLILNSIDLSTIGPISEASENINVPGSMDAGSLRQLVYSSGNVDPSNAVGAPGIDSSLRTAAGSAGGADSSELASLASGQVPNSQPVGGLAAPLGAIAGRSGASAPAPAAGPVQNVAASASN